MGTKISQLPAASSATPATDVSVVNVAGTTSKMTLLNILNLALQQTSVKTAAYTAIKNDHVLVDISGVSADVEITLPASPSAGDKVRVSVVAGHATYKVTFNRNSSLVMGGTSTGDYNVQAKGDSLYFEYTGATLGWVVISIPKLIPQISKSAAYTVALSDEAKHILHPSNDTTARTFTIPANSSVPFPIGTAITFVNQNGAGVLTIAITTDTMRLAGLGTTGSRTLAANGIATALKITATEWIISGTGLT